ncbi:MAG: type II toxin-antitoxin system death-on-curing family toxin [Myxococcota bacterium]
MPPNRLNPPPKTEGIELLNRSFLTQYHMRLLTLFGGSPGWREPLLVDLALERARACAGAALNGDLLMVVATYGVELSKGPFVEGNWMLAWIAMATTLRLNGKELKAGIAEASAAMREVSAGSWKLPELRAWLQARVEPLDP